MRTNGIHLHKRNNRNIILGNHPVRVLIDATTACTRRLQRRNAFLDLAGRSRTRGFQNTRSSMKVTRGGADNGHYLTTYKVQSFGHEAEAALHGSRAACVENEGMSRTHTHARMRASLGDIARGFRVPRIIRALSPSLGVLIGRAGDALRASKTETAHAALTYINSTLPPTVSWIPIDYDGGSREDALSLSSAP